jgi:hypothetical protein
MFTSKDINLTMMHLGVKLSVRKAILAIIENLYMTIREQQGDLERQATSIQKYQDTDITAELQESLRGLRDRNRSLDKQVKEHIKLLGQSITSTEVLEQQVLCLRKGSAAVEEMYPGIFDRMPLFEETLGLKLAMCDYLAVRELVEQGEWKSAELLVRDLTGTDQSHAHFMVVDLIEPKEAA